jgi:hypothetical protein
VFFAVIGKPQTWRNVGYLLLAFPLGIFYFVFLVVGLSLGFGLIITLLGIPLLVGVMAGAYGLGEFERAITNYLLGIDTPASHRLSVPEGWWAKVKTLITSSETWKRILYLFLEFPLGIVGFTLAVVTGAMFALVVSPLFYTQGWWAEGFDWLSSWWVVDEPWEALVVAIGGILVGFVGLHVMNGVAGLWGIIAKGLLGPSGQAQPAQEPAQPLPSP